MRKKKGLKFNYHYEKQHGIYAILGLIIVILLVFLFNNFGKCKIYSLSTDDDTYKVANGVLVLTNQKSILKMSNIEYNGDVVNIASITLTLCVDIDAKCNSIATMGSNAAEGMNLSNYLEKISFDINEQKGSELALTNKVRNRIVKNLFLKVDIVTLDGESVNDLIRINVDTEYRNNRLFY